MVIHSRRDSFISSSARLYGCIFGRNRGEVSVGSTSSVQRVSTDGNVARLHPRKTVYQTKLTVDRRIALLADVPSASDPQFEGLSITHTRDPCSNDLSKHIANHKVHIAISCLVPITEMYVGVNQGLLKPSNIFQ